MQTLNAERDELLARFELVGEKGKVQSIDVAKRIKEIQLRKLSHDEWTAAAVSALNKARRQSMRYQPGAQGPLVMAYINMGRWIADCPFCSGAELVEPGETFYCFSCGMEMNSGHPLSIDLPSNRDEIESVLNKRPQQHRNWRGESIELLRVQNAANGDE